MRRSVEKIVVFSAKGAPGLLRNRVFEKNIFGVLVLNLNHP